MRTTIEMRDEHRSALLQLAGRRGAKGFSTLIAEALDAYLKGQEKETARRKAALAVKGALRPVEANALRAATRAIRDRWR